MTSQGGARADGARSVQRSFRLSAATAAALDEAARGRDESRNSMVERYLRESLRRERHPMITFRTPGGGGRLAGLMGTRLDVHRVIETFKLEGGDVDATAAYFQIEPAWVRAAVDYYAEYGHEIDEYLADEARFAARERALWERAQALIA
jgi:uncharacterized protein (DUF433 family)